MVEAAGRHRLALEPAHHRRVLEDGRLQHLQADHPVQREVPGAVDLAHPALADQFLDLESTRDRLPNPAIGDDRRAAVHAHPGASRRQRAGAARTIGAARNLPGQLASRADDGTGEALSPTLEKAHRVAALTLLRAASSY